jgi:DNA-binding beta-propeller fold protein YncE
MESAMDVIIRVAGTGAAGDTGDDGPATEAQLNEPIGVAVTPDGGFLFADNSNNLVRKVSAEGVITRVAGTGAAGDTGDGGPATRAELNGPFGVKVFPGGGFLFSDNGNNVIRKVSPEGMITRVAGTGAAGDTGDGGPATEAQLNGPAGVAVTPGGGFLFSDFGNNVVRKVSPEGVITRLAGTGAEGDTGDGGPATEAQLNGPGGVAVTPDGGFLFSDVLNNVVRKVERRQR